MTNFGAIAILRALPEAAPARQVRVLIALETFRAEAGGWRPVGQDLLARTANVSRSTLKRARPELIAVKLITYQPGGRGPGSLSRYRIEIPDLKRGPHAEPLTGQEKGSTDGRKGVHPPGQKGSTGKTGKSSVPAGQPANFSANGATPALGAKAPALKAGAFSSAGGEAPALDGTGTSPPGTRHRAPPCPVCGKQFSQELLADPDFRALAVAGDVLHAECTEEDERRYLASASIKQLLEDGYYDEAVARDPAATAAILGEATP